LLILGVLAPGPGWAQDFASALLPGPGASACAFIERGLPAGEAGAALEASFTRWFGLAALETRAAACAVGWRALRLAGGVSQTGDPGIGWSACGLACGAASAEGAAGLRVVARRDRAPVAATASEAPLGPGLGLEVGGGAWLEAARGLRIWASVPQAWVRGVAPPLDRPLEIGARYERGDAAFWLARGAPSGESQADHVAGAVLRSGPLEVWGAVRDHPLRGGVGLSGQARGLSIAAEVEGHPELGQTVRLSVGLAGHPPKPTAAGGR
jgi:hypothetical protein